MFRPLTAVALLALFSTSNHATPADSTAAVERALDEELHQDPAWHSLLHYRPRLLGRGYSSQSNDDAFFLSEKGETDPRRELIATVEAVLAEGDGDEHARCQFPARDRWLRERLDLEDTPVSCPQLSEWLEELDTETVTLVFAASYLNNPSSIFGHTFLRLDPPQEKEQTDLLTAHTVSYAADANQADNQLLFTYRGIFGGYPGITTVEPYYEKINQYSDIENRDLYEYELNLTQSEIDMMLRHAWEVQDKHFDYYFFDQNCSYRLLVLMDVARPGTNLIEEVGTHAIPADTVRWVMDRDLVRDVHYRPASATVVAHQLRELDKARQSLAYDLAIGRKTTESEAVKAMPREEQARVIEAAFDYLRYATLAHNWSREESAPRSHELLMARSRLDAGNSFPPVPEPEVRDDQGHPTFRLRGGVGQQDDADFVSFGIRGAYHDLLDPPGGYPKGAQINFPGVDFRYYHDIDQLQVEHVTVVDIRSLTPRDRFFRPTSWQAAGGARRTRLETGERRLTPYISGGPGLSWQLGPVQLVTLATGELESSPHLRRGYDLAPGAELTLLHQGHRFSVIGSLRGRQWQINEREEQGELSFGAQAHLTHQLAVRGEIQREYFESRYETAGNLSLNLYF